MSLIYFIINLTTVLFLFLSYYLINKYLLNSLSKNKKNRINIYVLILLTVIVSLLFALVVRGHGDASDYREWIEFLKTNKISEIYEQTATEKYYCNYPSGFLWVLWILAKFSVIFKIPLTFLYICIPEILCHICIVLVIYHIAKKIRPDSAFWMASLMACNLAIFANSSLWGQSDNFLLLFTLLTVYYAYKEKWFLSGIFLALGLLFKLQIIFILPVLLIYFLVIALKNRKNFIKIASALLLTFILFVGLSLPFCINQIRNGNYFFIFTRYFGEVGRYNGFSMNAHNFWGALGLTFVSSKTLGIFGTLLSTLIILSISAFCIVLLLKNFSKINFIGCCCVIISLIFCFAFSMHERYNMGILGILLLLYIITNEKFFMKSFQAFSLLIALNMLLNLAKNSRLLSFIPWTETSIIGWVLYYFYFIVASILCVIYTIYFVKTYANYIKRNAETLQ